MPRVLKLYLLKRIKMIARKEKLTFIEAIKFWAEYIIWWIIVFYLYNFLCSQAKLFLPSFFDWLLDFFNHTRIGFGMIFATAGIITVLRQGLITVEDFIDIYKESSKSHTQE